MPSTIIYHLCSGILRAVSSVLAFEAADISQQSWSNAQARAISIPYRCKSAHAGAACRHAAYRSTTDPAATAAAAKPFAVQAARSAADPEMTVHVHEQWGIWIYCKTLCEQWGQKLTIDVYKLGGPHLGS